MLTILQMGDFNEWERLALLGDRGFTIYYAISGLLPLILNQPLFNRISRRLAPVSQV